VAENCPKGIGASRASGFADFSDFPSIFQLTAKKNLRTAAGPRELRQGTVLPKWGFLFFFFVFLFFGEISAPRSLFTPPIAQGRDSIGPAVHASLFFWKSQHRKPSMG